MSCRRCVGCAISYPPTVGRCQVCDQETVYHTDANADPEWQAAVAELNATPSVEEQRLAEWRRLRLTSLGFQGATLDLLVDLGADLHKAEDLVNAGCPPTVAALILL